MRLRGRVALVTGAASGNGLGIARKFLDEGASVVFFDINAEALKAVVPDGNDRALSVLGNVAEQSDAEHAVAAAIEQFDRLDILVNNAGIVRWSTFEDLDVAEWDEVMRVNSTGAMLFSQAAAKAMAPAEGTTASIVNITSIEAHVAVSMSGHPQIHYNASKGALHMFTKALALELAARRIRVNAIAPGFIETPFTAKGLSNPEVATWYLSRIPLGRIGKPEDVGAAAAFLASDDASYITGSTIFVDGGWMI